MSIGVKTTSDFPWESDTVIEDIVHIMSQNRLYLFDKTFFDCNIRDVGARVCHRGGKYSILEFNEEGEILQIAGGIHDGLKGPEIFSELVFAHNKELYMFEIEDKVGAQLIAFYKWDEEQELWEELHRFDDKVYMSPVIKESEISGIRHRADGKLIKSESDLDPSFDLNIVYFLYSGAGEITLYSFDLSKFSVTQEIVLPAADNPRWDMATHAVNHGSTVYASVGFQGCGFKPFHDEMYVFSHNGKKNIVTNHRANCDDGSFSVTNKVSFSRLLPGSDTIIQGRTWSMFGKAKPTHDGTIWLYSKINDHILGLKKLTNRADNLECDYSSELFFVDVDVINKNLCMEGDQLVIGCLSGYPACGGVQDFANNDHTFTHQEKFEAVVALMFNYSITDAIAALYRHHINNKPSPDCKEKILFWHKNFVYRGSLYLGTIVNPENMGLMNYENKMEFKFVNRKAAMLYFDFVHQRSMSEARRAFENLFPDYSYPEEKDLNEMRNNLYRHGVISPKIELLKDYGGAPVVENKFGNPYTLLVACSMHSVMTITKYDSEFNSFLEMLKAKSFEVRGEELYRKEPEAENMQRSYIEEKNEIIQRSYSTPRMEMAVDLITKGKLSRSQADNVQFRALRGDMTQHNWVTFDSHYEEILSEVMKKPHYDGNVAFQGVSV
uniref:Vacuolar protein sorting-associated protein 18 homolog n=1 Tax=Rhabditophanes sp. KR3021 TaxID=114890 RepID=A0AC35U4R5_9BILA